MAGEGEPRDTRTARSGLGVLSNGDRMIADEVWEPDDAFLAACSPERVMALIDVVEAAQEMAKIKDRWIGFEVHAPRKALRDRLAALSKALDVKEV